MHTTKAQYEVSLPTTQHNAQTTCLRASVIWWCHLVVATGKLQSFAGRSSLLLIFYVKTYSPIFPDPTLRMQRKGTMDP